jgi:outer membrane lipoprotein-sorting protein
MTSAGVVTYQKPSKANFAYTQPPGNRVLVNGQQILVTTASTNQTQTFTTNQMQMPAVLSFLSGQGQFASSFNFSFANVPYPGGYVLLGTPTSPSPYYTSVLFFVDSATSQITRVLVLGRPRQPEQIRLHECFGKHPNPAPNVHPMNESKLGTPRPTG